MRRSPCRDGSQSKIGFHRNLARIYRDRYRSVETSIDYHDGPRTRRMHPATEELMALAFVVDDDRQISALVARWLSENGHAVQTYNEFEEAKRRIEVDMPTVLVVDVRLRGFNGIHLAILARQLNPDARIVVLSGFDDPVLRRE